MKPIVRKIVLILVLLFCLGINNRIFSMNEGADILKIKRSHDFEVTGKGSAKQWEMADWVNLPPRNNPLNTYKTKVKILYSDTGVYFLFDCEDRKLTSTMKEDNLNLYMEDVIEVFLWTDETSPVYFEYELSPLNYELPIIVPNFEGRFFGWLPWHYEGERRTRHATTVKGGKKESGATCTSWTGEFFIPFKLLLPLKNVPPKSGTKWRANLYRIDYDSETTHYSWMEYLKTFHDYNHFGSFYFE